MREGDLKDPQGELFKAVVEGGDHRIEYDKADLERQRMSLPIKELPDGSNVLRGEAVGINLQTQIEGINKELDRLDGADPRATTPLIQRREKLQKELDDLEY